MSFPVRVGCELSDRQCVQKAIPEVLRRRSVGVSGRSARGSGGSDRRAIACVECLIRIRASACLFFSVGALWPVACGVPSPRTKWPAKTRASAACFFRYRADLRGRKSSSKEPSQVRRQPAQATGQRAPTEKKRQADARILIKHSTRAIALRSDPPLPRALRPRTPTERLLRTSGIVFWTHWRSEARSRHEQEKTRVVSQGELADEPM